MLKKALLFYIFFTCISSLIFGQSCVTIDTQPEDQLVLDNNNITLIVEASSSEILSYQWQVFNTDLNIWENISDGIDYSGTNSSTLMLINVMPSINGSQFRAVITGQDASCNDTSNPAIIRYIRIRVNTIFTPNDDGFNDTFTINGLATQEFRNNKLQVYNRWGNLVYEKTGYQNDWDGVATTGVTVNGSKKLPTGTYFYTLDLNYDNKKFSGWVYIVR